MSKSKPKPTPRAAVLVLVDADGFIRVFSDSHVDAHVAVVASCEGHEALAEHVAELLLPARYRKLFRDDKLRATGIYRRVNPSALVAARQTAIEVARLNGLKGGRDAT